MVEGVVGGRFDSGARATHAGVTRGCPRSGFACCTRCSRRGVSRTKLAWARWRSTWTFGDACKRLDLYGFSNGGPYYYNMASPNIMKQHHSAELESWVFHSLVRNHSNELRTCVHI